MCVRPSVHLFVYLMPLQIGVYVRPSVVYLSMFPSPPICCLTLSPSLSICVRCAFVYTFSIWLSEQMIEIWSEMPRFLNDDVVVRVIDNQINERVKIMSKCLCGRWGVKHAAPQTIYGGDHNRDWTRSFIFCSQITRKNIDFSLNSRHYWFHFNGHVALSTSPHPSPSLLPNELFSLPLYLV